MSGKASLTYYLFEGVLVGTANGTSFHISAGSGGRSGSKQATAVDGSVANNPYQTPRQYPTHPSGGPLPAGRYRIHKPVPNYKGKGRWATLTLEAGQSYGRGGFAIHGRGPRGSDGCIVPVNGAEFHRLMDALEADGGGTLFVVDAMGAAFA
jgi:hypothetical protein